MRFLGDPSERFVDKVKNILLAFALYALYILIFGHFMEWLTKGQIFFQQPPAKYTFFFTVIWPGLWEELAFRVIPITIAKSFGEKLVFPVILLSSLIFGWAHGGPVNLLIQGVMGFTLSCLYLKNNCSYWSIVVLHSGWNLFCLEVLERLN